MMGLITVLYIVILTFVDMYLCVIILLTAGRQRLREAVLCFISAMTSSLQVIVRHGYLNHGTPS